MMAELQVPQFVMQPEVDESWTIERVALECPPVGWEALFKYAYPEIKKVSDGVQMEKAKGHQIYPSMAEIFQAFRLTPLAEVKVVIVGQDPYFSKSYYNGIYFPTATGVSFSVRKWDKIPGTLQNIYKELSASVEGFITPDNGDLSSWSQQGVLMLNCSLTVREGQEKSHDPIVWDGFISKVVEYIKLTNPQCIYVMWGINAQKLASKLADPTVQLTAPHPSGNSAFRGFFGCNHFNLINEHLIKQGKTPINWQIPLLQHQWQQIYSASHLLQQESLNSQQC